MFAFIHVGRLLLGKAVAKTLNLIFLLRDAFAEARQARTRLEAELLRGRYRLVSNNDDDLPIVR